MFRTFRRLLQPSLGLLFLFGCERSSEPGTTSSKPAPTAANTASAASSQSAAPVVASPTASATARAVSAEVTALVLESDHSFALLSTGEVLGWGSNAFGVLALDKKTATQTSPVKLSAVPRIKQLSTGKWHACGLTPDGAPLCWGRDFGGALGDGTGAEEKNVLPSPVVDLPKVAAIDAGGSHTCATLADGKVSCWGVVVAGAVIRPKPVPKLGPLTSLSLGEDQSCGLTAESGVWCWDLVIGKIFEYGEAIEGKSGNIEAPSAVPGLSGVKKLVVSGTHACALAADGTVSCWGFGDQGQLGTGRSGEGYKLLKPTALKDLGKAVDIGVGSGFTCAALEAGTVSCWGVNDWGQLGIGSLDSKNSPATVKGVSGAVKIATGGAHACAATREGNVYCWGKNLSGQVGDGTSGFKATRREAVLIRKPE
jgi:alpha-tubulin suppressor-like RCC1 family protein